MLNSRTSLGLIACFTLVVGGMAACSDSETSNAANTTTANGGNNGGGGSGASGGNTGGGGSGATGGGGSGGGVTPMTNANCDAPSGAAGTLTAVEVQSGFSRPLAMTYAWGDGERLYVVEQDGVIQLLKGNDVSVFLDISNRVTRNGNEQGLLGLAFHPNYVNNGRFFVHYSSSNNGPAPNGDTVIEEYQVDPANPDAADPTPVQLIYTTGQFAGNHNGGTIAFSPVDGFLWIALGDGGGGGDPQDNGQDKNSPLATLLRLDIDGGQPYAIPAGNITDGLAEIHDWGLRNPFRMSFDICTGDRYIGDVGQDCYEEINAAPASAGPTNWGWNTMEADHCFGGGCNNLPNNNMCGGADVTDMVRPIVELAHGGNQGDSITGGHVYRGSAIPWLRGAYIYGEFARNLFFMLRWDGTSVTEGPTDITAQMGVGNPSAFGVDNDGELYFTSFNGSLYRIEAE